MRSFKFVFAVLIPRFIGNGIGLPVLLYFLLSSWRDENGLLFWTGSIVWMTMSFLYYFSQLIELEKCPSCDTLFSLRNGSKHIIEKFVKYRHESVNSGGQRFKKDVPYNCQRYLQDISCNKCGNAFQVELISEKRA